MAAYLIVNLDVRDPVGYKEYQRLAPPSLDKYGAKYLVRGGKVERLEGEWDGKRVVVLEFESVERARRWYASEEYRDAKEIRRQTAKTDMLLVEGV